MGGGAVAARAGRRQGRTMKRLAYDEPGFAEAVCELDRHGELPGGVVAAVRDVIEQVRRDGDRALLALTARFDRVELTRERLELTPGEVAAGCRGVARDVQRAVRATLTHVRAFARAGKRRSWSRRVRPGVRLGEKYDPIERVGVYIPGGTAPLASTALMTIPFARVAGVRDVIVCTPPGPGGRIAPELLYAIRAAGATRLFRVGGAQAVAAMALGTETVPAVHKLVGPGNSYVTAAKQLLVGRVSIDLLAGPSELLVIADGTARPGWVAADLLAQAEHGSGDEQLVLLTTSRRLRDRVEQEIDSQLPRLARGEYIRRVLSGRAWSVLVGSVDQAVELANRFAPEHIQIQARDARRLAGRLRNAGAIYIGELSPIPLGDFTAGPSHVLPTGGAGKSFSGLTVDQFQRKTSLIEYTAGALARDAPVVAAFARIEGLDAHGRAVAIRLAGETGE